MGLTENEIIEKCAKRCMLRTKKHCYLMGMYEAVFLAIIIL